MLYSPLSSLGSAGLPLGCLKTNYIDQYRALSCYPWPFVSLDEGFHNLA